VRQMLRDEIERQLPQDTGEVQAKLSVWVAADGRISRWEFEPLPEERGNKVERLDDAMRRSQAALQLPTPPTMPQPLRFSLQLRVGG
jgi:hypothetical protein